MSTHTPPVTTPSPPSSVALTLAQRAHRMMHPPPPPPPAAVQHYLHLDDALHQCRQRQWQLQYACERLTDVAVDTETAGESSTSVGRNLQSTVAADDDTVMTTPSPSTNAVATATAAAQSSTRSDHLSPSTPRRRPSYIRRTISARPTIVRRHLETASTRLQLSPPQRHCLVSAAASIAEQHMTRQPPQFSLQRTRAASTHDTRQHSRQSVRRHLQQLDTPAVLRHVQLTADVNASSDTATQSDASLLHTAQSTLTHLRQHAQRVRRELTTMTPAVVAWLHTQPSTRCDLTDGVLRLRARPVTMTRDSFSTALCEYLLQLGVVEPRDTVLSVTAVLFASANAVAHAPIATDDERRGRSMNVSE
jgi:hypothetical protein